MRLGLAPAVAMVAVLAAAAAPTAGAFTFSHNDYVPPGSASDSFSEVAVGYLENQDGQDARVRMTFMQRVRFESRPSRRKRLKPGQHRAVLRATDAVGRSPPRTLSFTIVKPHRRRS